MISSEGFKQECMRFDSAPEVIVQKYLIDGDVYFFKEIEKKCTEFDFKKFIAQKLEVHIRDIVVVGSGKLGFSLKPDSPGLYRYNAFDFDFIKNSDLNKSDLDVAIVSSTLFDKQMKNLFDHSLCYHEEFVKSWGNRPSFAKYFLKGKIATRFFPNDFLLTKEIEEIRQKFQMEFGREINIEIYKSWHYFETYHIQNIQNIQFNLIA